MVAVGDPHPTFNAFKHHFCLSRLLVKYVAAGSPITEHVDVCTVSSSFVLS
jgi:hypothetical protein